MNPELRSTPSLSTPGVTHHQTPSDAQWRAWFAELGPALYRYCRFSVGSADVADDLVAEMFLRAVDAFPRFDPRQGSMRAWLFQIARNGVRSYLRQQRRWRQESLASARDVVSDAPSPEERLLWDEEVRRVIGGVAMLAPRDREILSLRYGSQLETGEIGEILGLRDSAVRTRLSRSLQRLREVLGQ